MTNRVRIRTPSRLHFGLLGWGDRAPRLFGGVGLMIEDPGLEIVVESARSWEATGPLSERSLEVAANVTRHLLESGHTVGPLRIENVRVPAPHVGLGVGTQLSLAIARALTELAGLPATPVDRLARLTGRGRRSGIGIHGFAEGGLIVDGGRRLDQEVPTRLFHQDFPEDWWVLVIVPGHSEGIHGSAEIDAFRSLPEMPVAATEKLCRLVLTGLLPGLVENDLPAFGKALSEMQRVVGDAFAPVQKGQFARPEAEAMIERMTHLGLHGAGQSSWGPTLYAFGEQAKQERDRLRYQLIQEFTLSKQEIFWTQASRKGAEVKQC